MHAGFFHLATKTKNESMFSNTTMNAKGLKARGFMTMMCPEDYIRTGGSICPACEGDAVLVREYEFLGDGRLLVRCDCASHTHCKATWTEEYRLRGYRDDRSRT